MEINTDRLEMEASVDLKRLMMERAEDIHALTCDRDNKDEFTRVIAAFYRAGIAKGMAIIQNPKEYMR